MEVTTTLSRFHLFSTLPLELRRHIWRDALLNIGPTLCTYKAGCWRLRYVTESDPTYDSNEHHTALEWRHNLLEGTQFQIPLVFVNREARGIALDWVHGQGIKICSRDDGQQPIFSRPFDPMRDALYVPVDGWDDFLCDPIKEMFRSELRVVSTRTELRRLALPKELFWSKHKGIILHELVCHLLESYFKVEILLIIIGEQPDLPSADPDATVHPWWQVENTPPHALWNKDRGGFDFKGGEGKNVDDNSLYRLINQAIGYEVEQEPLLWDKSPSEVRPAFVVRR